MLHSTVGSLVNLTVGGGFAGGMGGSLGSSVNYPRVTNSQVTGLLRKLPVQIPMSMGLSNNRVSQLAYIINNKTNKKMNFQFAPTEVPYGRQAKYVGIESPGQNYPLTQYVNGQAREFSVELFYCDKPFTGKIPTARNFLMEFLPAESNVRVLEAIKPPTMTFSYGYFTKKCVMTSLNVEDIEMNESGLPVMTKFTLQLRQI